jgi:hypothetical protein
MFTKLLVETATVDRRTATGFDAYGNEIAVFAGSGEEQVDLPCRIYEKPGKEDDDERETVTRTALGFFEANADIEAYDRITVGATTWEVVSAPRRMLGARDVHHIEVDLEEVTA